MANPEAPTKSAKASIARSLHDRRRGEDDQGPRQGEFDETIEIAMNSGVDRVTPIDGAWRGLLPNGPAAACGSACSRGGPGRWAGRPVHVVGAEDL